MNVADSEQMLTMLEKEFSYELTDLPENADLIVLNTCNIREKARHKVLSRLGVLRDLKEKNPDLKIALAGCVAQAEGKKLADNLPYVDVVIGPGTIHQLPELLKTNRPTGHGPSVSLGFRDKDKEIETRHQLANVVAPAITGKNEVSRYVNITQGCDNFCTFCIVPFTRGRERSDRPEDILQKVAAYVSSGAREICLLGQNVNSYGADLVRDGNLVSSQDGPFVDLLKSACAIPGLDRLRFTTSNPHDLTIPLANLFATEPKLGKYMHLPVQSGSDRILEAMKRKVTRAEYMEKISWLRKAAPDISISTDLIVGFPGETEEDFAQTLELVSEVGFGFIFAFKFSPRKGTAASRFEGHLSDQIMTERLARLNALQDKITEAQNETEIGKVREVLFLYQSRKEPGTYYGRTPHFRLVKVASDKDLVGRLEEVQVISSNKTALEAKLARS